MKAQCALSSWQSWPWCWCYHCSHKHCSNNAQVVPGASRRFLTLLVAQAQSMSAYTLQCTHSPLRPIFMLSSVALTEATYSYPISFDTCSQTRHEGHARATMKVHGCPCKFKEEDSKAVRMHMQCPHGDTTGMMNGCMSHASPVKCSLLAVQQPT